MGDTNPETLHIAGNRMGQGCRIPLLVEGLCILVYEHHNVEFAEGCPFENK